MQFNSLLNSILGHAGVQFVRKPSLQNLQRNDRLFRALQRRLQLGASRTSENGQADAGLPRDVVEYLQPDNPRLTELLERYRLVDSPLAAHSFWTDDFVGREVDLRSFRGDIAYVWQSRDLNTQAHYLLTAYYLRTIDKLGLLERLEEDGLFGAETVSFEGTKLVSRDLLDSVSEISFLQRTLGISERKDFSVLDIGAGYGRLAHRLVQGLPGLRRVLCADAVAESTFLCEFYLRFRGVDHKAQVVPLDEIESALADDSIDLATNVCSFSECSFESVNGWLDLLRKHRVRFLMIVPDMLLADVPLLSSREADGSRRDYREAVLAKGYRLRNEEPKYPDPMVQKHGVSPTYHYLFELSD